MLSQRLVGGSIGRTKENVTKIRSEGGSCTTMFPCDGLQGVIFSSRKVTCDAGWRQDGPSPDQ